MLGLFVMTRSRMLMPHVVVTIWVRPRSSKRSINWYVRDGWLQFGFRQLFSQSYPGKFMSPAIKNMRADYTQSSEREREREITGETQKRQSFTRT